MFPKILPILLKRSLSSKQLSTLGLLLYINLALIRIKHDIFIENAKSSCIHWLLFLKLVICPNIFLFSKKEVLTDRRSTPCHVTCFFSPWLEVQEAKQVQGQSIEILESNKYLYVQNISVLSARSLDALSS